MGVPNWTSLNKSVCGHMGTPSPEWQTDTTENITFPHSLVGGNNKQEFVLVSTRLLVRFHGWLG